MSLRETIELWKEGVEKAEKGLHREAVDVFLSIPEPGARIYFNVANMCLSLNNVIEAEKHLDTCLKKDPNLAIGYFQRGCLHLLNRKNEDALSDFDLALKNLRGNLLIDYKQLGLIYKLYSCEVMYNRAYALYQIGRKGEAQSELEQAQKIAVESSESRHRVITLALEQLEKGESFLPYRLPKSAMLFVPPRTKTDVLNSIDFLGKAKVVSSVVDQDEFTGFVGAQKRKEKESSKSPTPGEPRGRIRPDDPPPKPNFGIPKRDSSLKITADADNTVLPQRDSSLPSKDRQPSGVTRPPKPSTAPPPPRSSSRSPNPSGELHLSSPSSRSPSPRPGTGAITIKVHYSSTRAIRVASSITFDKLLHLICRKFDRPDNSLSLWYKCNETQTLTELNDTINLKDACKNLEDGFRLTVWAYDHQTATPAIVLKEVVAISDYNAQYSDELSFTSGEIIQVLKEVNQDWYHGVCDNAFGIFPKSYVEDLQ